MGEIIVGMGGLEIGTGNDTLMSLGLGSCVGVILYDPASKLSALAHIMLPNSKDTQADHPNRRILIADNDNSIRSHIRNMLAGNFSLITEANEKEETVSLYHKLKPDILLISAFLPPTNGIDTMKTLKVADYTAKTIILSPSVDSSRIMEYLSSGAQEVLIAPFTEEKVKGCIEYALNRNMMKFADKAIPAMIGRLLNKGANRHNLIAKIVGGAHMFPTLMDEEIMNIGKRNIESVKSILKAYGIKITAEETGLSIGRTAVFDSNTGILHIKTKNGIKDI